MPLMKWPRGRDALWAGSRQRNIGDNIDQRGAAMAAGSRGKKNHKATKRSWRPARGRQTKSRSPRSRGRRIARSELRGRRENGSPRSQNWRRRCASCSTQAPGAATKHEEASQPAAVDFESLVVTSTSVLTPEAGLSGLQRKQLEAGIEYIDSADEAFEYTDENRFNVEKVVCPSTGQQFVRFTYYAGDTFCGFIVDPGTTKIRAMIEDGEVEPS